MTASTTAALQQAARLQTSANRFQSLNTVATRRVLLQTQATAAAKAT